MNKRISILMFLIDVMLTLIIVRCLITKEYAVGMCLLVIKVATMSISRMIRNKVKNFKTSEIKTKEEDESEEERFDK